MEGKVIETYDSGNSLKQMKRSDSYWLTVSIFYHLNIFYSMYVNSLKFYTHAIKFPGIMVWIVAAYITWVMIWNKDEGGS